VFVAAVFVAAAPRAVSSGAVGLVAWAWQHCLRAAWPFTIDDVGISSAHAQHLAEGRGPVAVVRGAGDRVWAVGEHGTILVERLEQG
jgi:hypothetical protein